MKETRNKLRIFNNNETLYTNIVFFSFFSLEMNYQYLSFSNSDIAAGPPSMSCFSLVSNVRR